MSGDEDNGEIEDSSSPLPRVVYVCATIEILVVLSWSISDVPSIRLIESAVCQRFYNSEAQIAENLCKGDVVQSSVAYLLGILSSLASLPTLLLTLPYGVLAEYVDRRLILLVNFVSYVASMVYIVAICYSSTTDLRLIWLSGLFDIIGGGGTISTILLRTMIAEAVPSSALSTIFFRLSGITTLIRLFGTSLGSWLLGNGAASTVLIGQSVYLLIIPLLAFIPGSGGSARSASNGQGKGTYQMVSQDEQDPSSSEDPQLKHESVLSAIHSFKDLILHSRPFTMCLIILFFAALAKEARSLIRPWMSKRYNWSLASTGYIVSFEALLGASILFILQHLNSRPTYQPSPSSRKRARELKIAIIGLLCGIAGSLFLGMSTSRIGFFVSTVVFSGSVGFLDSIKAFFTAAIGRDGSRDGKKDIGRLYSAATVVEYVAMICTAPAWSAVYSYGYSMGGVGMGIPFYGSALMMAIALLLVLRVKKTFI